MIIILPTLWRMDIEVDEETYLCNSMVDLLYVDQNCKIATPAKRKWLTSGGLNYSKNTEYSAAFDFLYRHQGFLVIAKEHLRALTRLLNYCKIHNIKYVVSAIQDPMNQLTGLDFIRDEIEKLLNEAEYQSWFRFHDTFIDQYLGHDNHPTTKEHKMLCKYILSNLK